MMARWQPVTASTATEPRLVRAPFFHTPTNPFVATNALQTQEDGGLLVANGLIADSGDFATVRARAGDVTVVDWRDGYVLPGLIDTHVHYPQLRIVGALGHTLLNWLEHVALPEEARMADLGYANDTAARFVDALLSHGTTTALAFGAHFAPATAALFEAAERTGLRLVTGLVLSDRALRADLHQSPDTAYRESRALVERFHGRGRLLYAVTPRFALSTSDAMLEVCQTLVNECPDVRIQTHINEQTEEIDAVVKAFPGAPDYLGIYERYGLVGTRTVLAHNVRATEGELTRLADARATVAHCPCSNAALGSGVFPLRRHIASGVRVALGTDVGGGTGFGLLKEALQTYLLQRVSVDGVALGAAHLLYLATRAGAEALGIEAVTGDLHPGRSADLIYVKPDPHSPMAAALDRTDTMTQALATIITMGGADSIADVWIGGRSTRPRPVARPGVA